MKRVVQIVVLLAVVAVVVMVVVRLREDRDGGAEGKLAIYGNVEIRQVALGFRVGGRIESMAFEEGDAVKAGETLAVLAREPLEDNLRLSEAEMGVAQAGLAKLEAGTRPFEIAQAREVVRERETALENARHTYERQLRLSKSGATSKQAVDDALALREAAAARLASAKDALALAEEGARAEDIAIARAEVLAAQARVARAKTQLEDARLVAPAPGIILTRVAEPGAIVAAGATVYALSLREPVWVRAYISEPDLGRIHPGMPLEVITDSRPTRPYAGQVGFISPVAEFTPKSVETEELRTDLVYRVRVIVKEPDEFLRQGMPVTVRIANGASAHE